MIKIDRSFILMAKCAILYNGRARSTLKTGQYLILRKGDGSLLIHGNSKLVALNYQSSGSIMLKEGNTLISKRKDEEIIIKIDHIINYIEIHNWSDNKIDISKTENDLNNHIVDHIDELTGDKITEIKREFMTPYGKVDILAVGNTHYNIIETKRSKASINSCAQLWKYMEYFIQIKQPSIGWIMSPNITDNALKYLAQKNLRWKQVQHQ